MRDTDLARIRVFIAGTSTFYGYNIQNVISNSDTYDLVDIRGFEKYSILELSAMLKKLQINSVVVASGLSYGIKGNISKTADLCLGNVADLNLIAAAATAGIKKLIYIASSCMYPREPNIENEAFTISDILTSPPESTSLNYTLMKLAGWSLCESIVKQYGYSYITLIPSNVYGPMDDFETEDSHVVSALIRKIYYAKKNGLHSVDLLGTGRPVRDFLHVCDLAGAVDYLIKKDTSISTFNIGSGNGVSISQLSEIIKECLFFTGKIKFLSSGLDGTMYKVLNTSEIEKLGWSNFYSLKDGISNTIDWYIKKVK